MRLNESPAQLLAHAIEDDGAGSAAPVLRVAHGDAAAVAHCQQSFRCEPPVGPCHGVPVDPKVGGQLARRREALARLELSLGDGLTKLSDDLFFDRLVAVELHANHKNNCIVQWYSWQGPHHVSLLARKNSLARLL